jgi:hypothetical protein
VTSVSRWFDLSVLLSTLISGQALNPGGMRPLQRPDCESVCWLSSDLRLRWSFRSVEKVDYISDVAGRRSISRSSDCPAARWELKRGATKWTAPLILWPTRGVSAWPKGGVWGCESIMWAHSPHLSHRIPRTYQVCIILKKNGILRSSGIKTDSVSEVAKGYPPGLRLL